jgi:hypothetical protein
MRINIKTASYIPMPVPPKETSSSEPYKAMACIRRCTHAASFFPALFSSPRYYWFAAGSIFRDSTLFFVWSVGIQKEKFISILSALRSYYESVARSIIGMQKEKFISIQAQPNHISNLWYLLCLVFVLTSTFCSSPLKHIFKQYRIGLH